jgi:hypothetical protein
LEKLLVQTELAGFSKVSHVARGAGDELSSTLTFHQAAGILGVNRIAADAIQDALFEKHVVFNFEFVAHADFSWLVAKDVEKL